MSEVFAYVFDIYNLSSEELAKQMNQRAAVRNAKATGAVAKAAANIDVTKKVTKKPITPPPVRREPVDEEKKECREESDCPEKATRVRAEVFSCPICKSVLRIKNGEEYCFQCGRVYNK